MSVKVNIRTTQKVVRYRVLYFDSNKRARKLLDDVNDNYEFGPANEASVISNLDALLHKIGVYDIIQYSNGKKANELATLLDTSYNSISKYMDDYMTRLGDDVNGRRNRRESWHIFVSAKRFLSEIISACKKNPDATIEIPKEIPEDRPNVDEHLG